MDIKKIVQSKAFIGIIIGIGIAAAVILIFQAGVWAGYRKAATSFRFGDNYYRFVGGQRGRFAPGLPHGEFPDANGAVGRIIKIELPTIVIEDRGRVEKTVVIKEDTSIMRFRETIQPEDLKTDDFVVVIGSPDDQSQIEAKLIRVMPKPMTVSMPDRKLGIGYDGCRAGKDRLFRCWR